MQTPIITNIIPPSGTDGLFVKNVGGVLTLVAIPTYTAGDGITITNGVIAAKIADDAFITGVF